MPSTQRMRLLRRHGMLFLLLVVGFFFRSVSPSWDAGARIHPDEALIVNGALSVKFFSQLFPGFHDYNGLSVYLLAFWGQILTVITGNVFWSTTPEGLTVAGRLLAATIATTAVIPLYKTGKLLGSKEAGLIAAWLFTFTPLLIQLAHFYTTENILLFLITLLMYQTVRFMKRRQIVGIITMGIIAGLLLATKNTAYLLLTLPLLAIGIGNDSWRRKLWLLSIFGAVTVVLFFFFSPYSFLDYEGYLARSRYLADVVSGKLPMDWTIQFAQTTPLFWFHTLPRALGIPFFIGGAGIVIYLFQRQRNPLLGVMAFWSLGIMMFLAVTYLKFTRYVIPLIPVFCLFAAMTFSAGRKSGIGSITVMILLIVQLLLGSMYASVYFSPHTSVSATDWIQKNIPPASALLIEEWNSIIRFSHSSFTPLRYRITSLNFYAPDTPQKNQILSEALHKTDYIILESPKVENTVIRLQNRYPDTARFYTDLAAGNLGFVQVAEFSSYPRFGPFVFPDTQTEETFTVFDHPTIRIYRKTDSIR
jgi:hypothetical protein